MLESGNWIVFILFFGNVPEKRHGNIDEKLCILPKASELAQVGAETGRFKRADGFAAFSARNLQICERRFNGWEKP